MAAPTVPSAFFLSTRKAPAGQPVGILADAIDPSTGEYLSLERGFDPTDADVLDALSTVRDSGAAVLGKGQRFRSATHITPALAVFFAEETREALRRLIESRQIRLLETRVREDGDVGAELEVRYVNLARAEDRTARLPVQVAT